MYNPVSMKIDDPKRLEEKDQRERNKKARFQVRYEYDKITKEETIFQKMLNKHALQARIKKNREITPKNQRYTIKTKW